VPSDDRIPVTYTVPPAALQSPTATEDWVNSLPPDARAQFLSKARTILRSLPEATRIALARRLVQEGIRVPEELATGGLGDAAPSGGADAGVGAAVGMLIGAAATVYSNQQTLQANNRLNDSANATNTQIAQINANAGIAINQAFATAQAQAAAYHAQTSVSTMPTIAKWSAIGVLGLAAMGFGAWYLVRRRRK
jgi:hypothetical protein